MSNTPTSTTTTVRVNNRIVEQGTELSFRGARGRYRFQWAELADDGEVTCLTVYGGPTGHGTFRSFAPDRVRTVHRVDKLREGTVVGGSRR